MDNKTKVKAFEPATVFIGTILAVLSAIVCMQILGKVGVSANTSILGAIFAMLVSRIPVTSMKGFKNLEKTELYPDYFLWCRVCSFKLWTDSHCDSVCTWRDQRHSSYGTGMSFWNSSFYFCSRTAV